MDNNNRIDIRCDHLVFEPSLIERRMCPSLSNQSCINFNFLVKLKRFIVFRNIDGSTEHYAGPDLNTSYISAKLMFEDFTLMSEIRECLFGPLVSLPLWEEERRGLVRCAWDAAAAACVESVRRRVSGCVDIDLEFKLLLEHEYVFYSEAHAATEHDYSMLKKYEMKDSEDEEESCCICLEDLDGGQVLCTPCDHVFHGDCIKIWLSTSPFCPLCRFQINTRKRD